MDTEQNKSFVDERDLKACVGEGFEARAWPNEDPKDSRESVMTGFSELIGLIEDLDNEIRALEENLDPILRDSEPSPAKSFHAHASEGTSAIVREIYGAQSRLHEITQRLNSIRVRSTL